MGDQEHGHAPLGLETAQQVEDLRLDGDVEGRGRLIGDEKGGPAGESHGDHGALAQPAGELVGKVAGPLGCRGNLDELEHLDGARPRFLATGPAVGEHGGRNLVADGEHGIERGHRLLEHHGDARAAHPAHGLGVHGEEILALESTRPAATRPGGCTSRMMDSDVTLLPHPLSPTSPSTSPLSMAKLTPSTARSTPWSVAKCVSSPSTESSGGMISQRDAAPREADGCLSSEAAVGAAGFATLPVVNRSPAGCAHVVKGATPPAAPTASPDATRPVMVREIVIVDHLTV